ncbi:MAG TPA: TetR/AcrR family transcriptional regulator [Trebonia sp.]
MRTHDTRVGQGADHEAIAGDPGTVSLTAGPVPAPNVRVAPAASHGRKAAPAPGGAWCDVQDTGAPDTVAPGTGTPDTVTPETGEAPDAARRPGRPRSERAEQSIIEATIEALAERGIDGVHCEDVAARAGVGKATLYRRWGGKEDLLIAAFAAMKHPLPEPRGESVREDLITLLTVVAADADDPRFAQQYALLHGAGERYPRLVARYREQVVEPRRDLVRAVLRRGIETGELRPGIDVEVAMLMLTGAVMARGKHDPTPAAPGFVNRAVDELLRGIAVDRAG